MTIQETAHAILSEAGKPMSAKELAQIALDRGFPSSAKSPVQSLAQTLEKNVRDNIYNKPPLKFIHVNGRRLLGLVSWVQESAASATTPEPSSKELTIQVPHELLEQIQLAAQAKVADTFEETVALLLRKGLSAVAPQIREGLMEQLDKLGTP